MSEARNIEPAMFVFVVGTPGSGKSQFCKELEVVLGGNRIKSSKHGDYPFLQMLFRADQGAGVKDRFAKGSGGAEFVVKDPTVYDLALKEVYEKVLLKSTEQRTIKIVEFARPRYDTAFLYYTLRALLQSVIVHISTPIDVCIQRNEGRRQKLEERRLMLEKAFAGQINPEDIFDEDKDLHYVPLKVMLEFYARDPDEDQMNQRNQQLILSLLPARGYISIENGADDLDVFRAAARDVADNQLLPLIENSESFADYYQRRLREVGGLLSPPSTAAS